jgi:hypothetical protein
MRCEILIGQGGKRNLLLDNPLIAGASAIQVTDRSVESFGAVMTPVLSQTQAPWTQPAFIRTSAGYLLSEGYGKQAWQQARRLFRMKSSRRKPILATILPTDASEAFKMAQGLGGWEQIEGIVIYPADNQTPPEMLAITRAIKDGTDLPLFARLPFTEPISFAGVFSNESVAALIVAAPPWGEWFEEKQPYLLGELHSSALVPLYAHLVRQVKSFSGLPIIARADAGSTRDVLTLARAGAEAVILEGAEWAQPGIASEIWRELEDHALQMRVGTWQAFIQQLRQEVT